MIHTHTHTCSLACTHARMHAHNPPPFSLSPPFISQFFPLNKIVLCLSSLRKLSVKPKTLSTVWCYCCICLLWSTKLFVQLWAGDPVIINCSSAVRGRQTLKQKCHSYWSQYWNRMDVATILLFGFDVFLSSLFLLIVDIVCLFYTTEHLEITFHSGCMCT